MYGIIKVQDIVSFTEKELICKFTPVSNFDFMFEAGKDYCLFSPVSIYASQDYYTLQISEREYEKLMGYETALLVIRHYGGFVSILKFSHLKPILTKKTLITNETTGDRYYELHIHKEHIEAVNSQAVIKLELTKL